MGIFLRISTIHDLAGLADKPCMAEVTLFECARGGIRTRTDLLVPRGLSLTGPVCAVLASPWNVL